MRFGGPACRELGVYAHAGLKWNRTAQFPQTVDRPPVADAADLAARGDLIRAARAR